MKDERLIRLLIDNFFNIKKKRVTRQLIPKCCVSCHVSEYLNLVSEISTALIYFVGRGPLCITSMEMIGANGYYLLELIF